MCRRYNLFKRVLTMINKFKKGKCVIADVFLPKAGGKRVLNKPTAVTPKKTRVAPTCSKVLDSQASLSSLFSQEFEDPETPPSRKLPSTQYHSDDDMSQLRLTASSQSPHERYISGMLSLSLPMTQASPPTPRNQHGGNKKIICKRMLKWTQDAIASLDEARRYLSKCQVLKDDDNVVQPLSQAVASVEQLQDHIQDMLQ